MGFLKMVFLKTRKMIKTHSISSKPLEFEHISTILGEGSRLKLSNEARKRIVACRIYLDKRLEKRQEHIYGINTGFGALHNKSISKMDLEQLQENLLVSHACGMGEEVPEEIVKLMLLLKIQGLSYGYSGVQPVIVDRLIDFFNADVLPVVYQQGSLGASGDLAPLAHMSLPLLGMGEVHYKGKKQTADDVLKQLNLQPIQLKSKEGLALLNGTQFMSAYGVWCLLQTKRISTSADFIAAISLDAYDGR